MLKRSMFSAAFVIGGIVSLLILLALEGFAQGEAGMSAGSVSPSSPPDPIIIFVLCGYFFVSAFGISTSNSKSALRIWAVAAHTLLVIDYVMTFISLKDGDPEGYKWPSEVGEIAMIMAVYFLPWLIVWGIILSSIKREEVIAPQ